MLRPSASVAAAFACASVLAAAPAGADVFDVDVSVDLDASQYSVLSFSGVEHLRWGPMTIPVTPFTMHGGDTADITVRFADGERLRVGYVDGYFFSPFQLLLAGIDGTTANASFPSPGMPRPYQFLDYSGDLETPSGSLAGGGSAPNFVGGNGDHRFTDTEFEFGGISFTIPISGFTNPGVNPSFQVTGIRLMIGADSFAIIPEPASLALLAAGGALLVRRRR